MAGSGSPVMNTRRAVRALTRAALDPDRPGTVGDLARVVATATGSRGAVLWEAPGEAGDVPTLSVLALWLDEQSPAATSRGVAADPVTELAFSTRSLAVPDDLPAAAAQVYGYDVTAALPIDYADDCHGVVTLIGGNDLDGAGFDTVVELVEILPELCSTVRERQTLALVNACNTILHDADIESPDRPLLRQRLGEHLSEVCHLVAGALRCTEVSIFLEDRPTHGGRYRLLASSASAGGGSSAGTEKPVNLARSGSAAGNGPLMELQMLSGERVSGFVRCRGTDGPPHHFTASDRALLHPIVAQVSRYCRNWRHRWVISEENESWRRLAAGVTEFNKLLAEKLDSVARDRHHEQQVSEMAVRIVTEVVPESTGATVFQPATSGDAASTLVPVASTGNGYRRDPAPGSGIAMEVLRTRTQDHVTDQRALVAEGIVAGRGWLLCTPIRVGEQVYGVLEAVGPDPELPSNSAQVHAIIGDQIGLYRHLRDTLRNLQDTRHRLEVAHRSEAEAMEDLKHQLVSPLRTATDRTDAVLRGGCLNSRAEAQLKAVRGLCRKAGRVAMSAGVFATLSKGGTPEPRPERIGVDDLTRMLIEAADDAQALGNPRRGILFDVERDSVRKLGRRLAEVDVSFLQQCVGNLLDNAAKYAYEGTRVQIETAVTGDQLAVEVTSTGLPIAPRDLARCIKRNWRGEAARSTTGEGSGLGLWIVDNLMRAMCGHVRMEAAADRTTVRLVLPLA